ncbi:hypothetical protein LR48_Vigan158s000100 [Vigna angularis]|uniref:Uncharacterized protein n=1 Tax=Phaseolus angularis TaxID=3914 RepID=A0A0L9T529_PHAAN|nr:hypothetical protein LR48_Vigan158s000100 [Vigna angularis]
MDQSQFWQAAGQFENQPQQQWQKNSSLSESLEDTLQRFLKNSTSVPPFERPRKAIDEAYYRQYCGGEDAAQPVPPRHARRERGPAQSRTFADAHEAEPFQMRDMYMSLIGAQLQSIHRGQVATAEMIVGMYDNPPAHSIDGGCS